MSNQGVVKSFNGGKGYGFITSDADGCDIFVHQMDCGGAAPKAGDTVTFEMQQSPSQPGKYVAKSVQGCTGIPEELKGDKGGGKGGKAGGKSQGTGQFQGTVKSFVEAKGYGFIVHQGDGDIFFHQRDMVDGSVPDRGDVVRYDLEANAAKPGTQKATNVTGGSKGKGQGKGKDFGGKGMDYGKGSGGSYAGPAWGTDPWASADAWGGAGKGKDAWGCGGKGGPYGGGGAWGGDAWGCGGKGGDAWGCGGKGKSFKGGW